MDEIREGAGTQFDPKLAEVFLSIVKEQYTTAMKQNIE